MSEEKPGELTDEGQARIFPCEGCGADLKFHIGQQHLKCPYCGFEKRLEFAEDAAVVEQDFHAMLIRLRKHHDSDRHDEIGQREISCSSCRGTVQFQGSLTSTECPFCASPIQREDVHDAEHRVPVDGVLPFLVEKDVAAENLKAWIQSRWFAPNEFRQRGVLGKFNGVYTPFWTFDSMTFTRYSGERGDYYYETVKDGDEEKQVRQTRWSRGSGSFDRFFDDVLILAADGLPRRLIDGLAPWPLHRCVPFSQQVLAGFYARTYELELEPGFGQARHQMENDLAGDVRRRIGGDEQRVHSCKTRYSAVTFKHLLLPVWLLAYRYNGTTYQVLVNAATGEVQGQRPWSWIKILCMVATLAAVAGAVALLNR